MKKLRITGLILAFILAFTGCMGAGTSDKNGSTGQKDDKKLKIVASFYPAYDLVKQIAGDKAEVTNLTQTGSAHGYEPSIEDMKKIVDSDLLVVNGAGFESWLDKVKQANPNLTILDLSTGIELIKNEEADHDHEKAEDKHDNDHDHEGAEDKHDHDHDNEGEGHHHHHGPNDPHIWLSLKNAAKMLENIKNQLIKLDPQSKDYFESNYKAYAKKLADLDKKYTEALAPYKGRYFVVPHEAYGYLARDYHLNQLALEGVNSDSEPNLTRMAEITKIMKDKQIKTIFYEYAKSDKLAQAIASEIGGNVKALSTLEVISDDLAQRGNDYASLMEMNLKNLVESFEGK